MSEATTLTSLSGGLWPAIGTALVLLLGGGYKAIRVLKSDNRTDKNAELADGFYDRLYARVKELEAKNDQLLEDRNKDREEFSELKFNMQSLEIENKSLRAQLRYLISVLPKDTEMHTEQIEEIHQFITTSSAMETNKDGT